MSLAANVVAALQAVAADIKALISDLSSKQDTLVSGTSIKTVNGNSLLGSGDLPVSLPDITESKNGASPNVVVPVVQLAATGAEANIDIALVPKGTGAIAAQVADGTAAGGSKRGAYAVDWQTVRSTASSVAYGANSVVAGGAYNRASGNNATVSGGSNNTAGGLCATVSGGSSSTVNGAYATVSGGAANTASGIASTVPGGEYANTRSVIGAYAWAGNGASSGRTQTEQFVLRVDTTDATATRLTTDGSAASATNGPILPNAATYHCRVRVVARNTTTGDSKSWTGAALIHREASAAATAFIGTPTLTSDFASSSLSAITAALSADTTNGGLAITVTGLASTTIRWVAHVETLEATN